MEAFTQHTGRVLPLRQANVDTDQIIPAWREDPAFVLNQPAYDGATILVAGTDFGIGSSREHAVWALTDYGFRVVIAPRFADIFRNNATKSGLLPVVLPASVVTELQDLAETDPAANVTVDLDAREVRYGASSAVPFEIDDYTRWRLMEGFDDIGLTLRHADDIAAFEEIRPSWLPVTA